MQSCYAKPYMTITELTEIGLTRDYLKQLSRAEGAPIIKTMGGGKIFFKTSELDEFMKKVTETTQKRSNLCRLRR